jgi:(p)ppGpp synthase/HD superfamily hydrolase
MTQKNEISLVESEVLGSNVVVFVKELNSSFTLPNGSTILDLAILISRRKSMNLLTSRQNNSPAWPSTILLNNAIIELKYDRKETFSPK